jgi:hypothetical protein
MESLMFFLIGACTVQAAQFIIGISSTYKIFKMAEIYAIRLLIDCESWRIHSLKVLELMYEHSEKNEQYNKIAESINKKYIEAQQKVIKLIRDTVPYSIPYNNLKESEIYVRKELEKLQGEENGS